MNLQSERTICTLLTESDFPEMVAMSQEEDTFKYIKKLRIMNPEEYDRYLLTKLDEIKNKTGYHWAVRLKTDRSFVGALNLNPIAGTNKIQIGCQLKRAYWGQGFASELTKMIFDFAVHELKLPEVYGIFQKENQTSRRLLEKLGFTWVESKRLLDEDVEFFCYVTKQG